MPTRTAKSILLTLATLLLPAVAGAQTEYLRITKDAAEEPAALQAPIISFESTDGGPGALKVDLVGAVHMADRSFFSALNDRFGDYDAVLFELVAPEGARPRPDAAPTNMVGFAQIGLTQLLGLSYQLNEIDYSRPNFVHADLTPEAMAQSMSERGESVLGYVSRVLTAAMQEDVPESALSTAGPGLLETIFSPDRERLLKIYFARSMLDIEWFTRIIEGDEGSSLIEVRNTRALEVLADRIRRGDRRLAIFYGVGHMPDLSDRLVSEFGLIQTDVAWLDAWNLSPGETELLSR